MSLSRKSGTARQCEKWRHAVGERLSMKISMQDGKASDSGGELRLRAVS